MQKLIVLALVAFSFVFLAGCTAKEYQIEGNTVSSTYGYPPGGVEKESGRAEQGEKENNIDEVGRMEENPIVVFETEKGKFEAEIFVNEAPITGENFMNLVNSGFYNGLAFHRVEPGFVVQGGDPKGDGTGGSNKTIPLEAKPELKHEVGSLGMARSREKDSASSQFYVVTGEASFLDGEYAVFGKVLEGGMEVVRKIEVGDKMDKVYEKK